MAVGKTSVEINEDLLVAVQRVLSTATIKDLIEEAFREVLRAAARRDDLIDKSALARLQLAAVPTGWPGARGAAGVRGSALIDGENASPYSDRPAQQHRRA